MKVAISRTVPDSGIKLLQEVGIEIDHHDSTTPLPSEELLARCRDADGLWCLLDDPISRDFMEACPDLNVIANYAVGYDNIDLDAANDLGIIVTNTPGVLSQATADFSFGLLIALARRVIEGHEYLMQRREESKFDGWESTLLLGSEVSGKTLGVLGAGRIGSVMARRGRGFDMEVLYHARSTKPELDAIGCKFVDFNDIIRKSDFLSLHLPLTERTEHIIGKSELLAMKSDAYLVNTGRGKLIDEAALVDVLEKGHLSGVALDVFEDEPVIHPGLFNQTNVIMTPHIASATIYARQKMSLLCGQAIVDVFGGNIPKNSVT